jgi:hypothetical protein
VGVGSGSGNVLRVDKVATEQRRYQYTAINHRKQSEKSIQQRRSKSQEDRVHSILTLRYVRPAPAIGSNYYSTFNLTVSCSCEACVCRIGDADVEEFDAGVTELAKSLPRQEEPAPLLTGSSVKDDNR